ncbi:MAG: hypothetical protein D3923_10660 [Candidatus Electrothrix sp. AR3]|nr:hypothetical protein [Candidatus Electrothrix sp. AR3]
MLLRTEDILLSWQGEKKLKTMIDEVAAAVERWPEFAKTRLNECFCNSMMYRFICRRQLRHTPFPQKLST